MSSKEWPCCFHGHSIIPTWNILKILCLWSENRTQVNSSWVTEPLTVWIINIHNHATWAFKYVIRLAFCIVICLSLISQNCQKTIGWPCCFPGHPGAWLAMAPELRVETSLLGENIGKYWMTLLLPWPSRRMAWPWLQSWELRHLFWGNDGDQSSTASGGGKRWAEGEAWDFDTNCYFCKKMHIFFKIAVSKSAHAGLKDV